MAEATVIYLDSYSADSALRATFRGNCGHRRQLQREGAPLPCATPRCWDGTESRTYVIHRRPPPISWVSQTAATPLVATDIDTLTYERRLAQVDGERFFLWAPSAPPTPERKP